MCGWIFWLVVFVVFVVLCIVGLVMLTLGTRSRVSTGGYCEVDVHWWFGRWVRCVGGERCSSGEKCILLWRKRGSEEDWADAGVVPGGSVKWSKRMEYQCVCRIPRS